MWWRKIIFSQFGIQRNKFWKCATLNTKPNNFKWYWMSRGFSKAKILAYFEIKDDLNSWGKNWFKKSLPFTSVNPERPAPVVCRVNNFLKILFSVLDLSKTLDAIGAAATMSHWWNNFDNVTKALENGGKVDECARF